MKLTTDVVLSNGDGTSTTYNKLRGHVHLNPGTDKLALDFHAYSQTDNKEADSPYRGRIEFDDAELSAEAAKTSDGWMDFYLSKVATKTGGSSDLAGTVFEDWGTV